MKPYAKANYVPTKPPEEPAPVIEDIDEPEVEEDVEQYVCPYCGKEYDTETGLKTHITRWCTKAP